MNTFKKEKKKEKAQPSKHIWLDFSFDRGKTCITSQIQKSLYGFKLGVTIITRTETTLITTHLTVHKETTGTVKHIDILYSYPAGNFPHHSALCIKKQHKVYSKLGKQGR